jgi:tRNA(Ile)-lysidine synthase
MYNIFFEHIKNDFDFLKKSKLLVCVSGGLDSMVLIDLLYKTKHDVSVAHCNFKLRKKESDLDEEFVREYCLNNSIPFFFKNFCY